jgi:hypothetical protein
MDASDEFKHLLDEKAERLSELQKRKPGQKHYKRALKAFLEMDAEVQRVLLSRVEALDEERPFAASPADEPTEAGVEP